MMPLQSSQSSSATTDPAAGASQQLPSEPTNVVGYTDRLDYLGGDDLQVMLHGPNVPVRLDVVALRSADERVSVAEPVSPVRSVPGIEVVAGLQQTCIGSYGLVHGIPLADVDAFELELWLSPTLLSAGHEQGLVTLTLDSGIPLLQLALSVDQHLELRCGGTGAARAAIRLERPVLEGRWTLVSAKVFRSEATMELTAALDGRPDARESRSRGWASPGVAPESGSATLLLAAASLRANDGAPPQPQDCFNGKLEGIRLSIPGRDRLLLDWDFAQRIEGWTVSDRSGNGLDGRLLNAPTRGVTGRTWQRSEVDFRLVRDQFAAVHFHEDDFDDAGWIPTARLRLPPDLPSGIYAVRVTAERRTEHLPFFLLPPRSNGPRPAVAFLAPTWTYQAYANASLGDRIDYRGWGLSERELTNGPRDRDVADHPELAGSLYDVHRDGSGRCFSSCRRPIFNFRPDYRSPVQQAPRHLPADLFTTTWLDRLGQPYDVLTDHLLDESGLDALRPYRVVITGSHPEYASLTMLDAIEAYIESGGRLMYLGGNGFYWVTSRHGEHPWLIECRRGNSGTRTWSSAPGEQHHASTGELGGLWRHRGRAPNALVGVGMASQGWDLKAPGYRRTAASYAPGLAWMFEGITEEVLGDFGLVMDGASGDELDRYDAGLGSPPEAVVLATSLPHSRYYKLVVEDVPMLSDGLDGATNPLVRSDVVFLERPGGGAVFSVGSIAWAGSMAYNDFDNNVARLTTNVLARFSALGPGAPA